MKNKKNIIIILFLMINVFSCSTSQYITFQKTISLSGYLPYKDNFNEQKIYNNHYMTTSSKIKKQVVYEKIQLSLFDDDEVLNKSIQLLQNNQAQKAKQILYTRIKVMQDMLLNNQKNRHKKLDKLKIELLGKYYNNLAVSMLALGNIVKANEYILLAGGYLQNNHIILNNVRDIASFESFN